MESAGFQLSASRLVTDGREVGMAAEIRQPDPGEDPSMQVRWSVRIPKRSQRLHCTSLGDLSDFEVQPPFTSDCLFFALPLLTERSHASLTR